MSGGYRLSMPNWGIKEYELKPRKDGVYTWRLTNCWSVRSGRVPSTKLIREAEAYAEAQIEGETDISFLYGSGRVQAK